MEKRLTASKITKNLTPQLPDCSTPYGDHCGFSVKRIDNRRPQLSITMSGSWEVYNKRPSDATE